MTTISEPEQEYEYCVMQERRPGVHRGPWSQSECRAWVQECEDMGMRPGAFYVARRPVAPWERITHVGAM